MNDRVEKLKLLLESTDVSSLGNKVLSKLDALLLEIEKQNSLDHDFLELLQILADGDNAKLHDVEQYSEIIKEIEPNSTVIYFKSAGLVRVYEAEDLQHYFTNRARADYRDQPEIYEVVNDDKPQKIVIIIDSRDRDELEKVKQYILDFSKEVKSELNEKDLVIFDNTHQNTFEIVIKSWFVKNAEEKNARTTQLLKYMSNQEKNAQLVKKINQFAYSEIPNASTITAAGVKKLISPFINELDGFVNQQIPIIFLQNVVNGTQVLQGDHCTANVKHMEQTKTEISDEDFITHLENGNFEWYKLGNRISLDVLVDEYCKFSKISSRGFSSKFKDILYKSDKRVKKNGRSITMVILI